MNPSRSEKVKGPIELKGNIGSPFKVQGCKPLGSELVAEGLISRSLIEYVLVKWKREFLL
jgi:hypothetical protein